MNPIEAILALKSQHRALLSELDIEGAEKVWRKIQIISLYRHWTPDIYRCRKLDMKMRIEDGKEDAEYGRACIAEWDKAADLLGWNPCKK